MAHRCTATLLGSHQAKQLTINCRWKKPSRTGTWHPRRGSSMKRRPIRPRYKPLRLRKHEGCTKLVITLVPTCLGHHAASRPILWQQTTACARHTIRVTQRRYITHTAQPSRPPVPYDTTWWLIGRYVRQLAASYQGCHRHRRPRRSRCSSR
ncbi:hypothetical protein BC826DRAFT_274851 [Russula brevipes]|nr:hypothetical protein BC826DRAFT_274851 [Russula brevipes]